MWDMYEKNTKVQNRKTHKILKMDEVYPNFEKSPWSRNRAKSINQKCMIIRSDAISEWEKCQSSGQEDTKKSKNHTVSAISKKKPTEQEQSNNSKAKVYVNSE